MSTQKREEKAAAAQAVREQKGRIRAYQSERLLKMAGTELKRLRQNNRDMALRLSMFDDVMSALHGQAARSSGLMSAGHPDLVTEIEDHLKAESELDA